MPLIGECRQYFHPAHNNKNIVLAKQIRQRRSREGQRRLSSFQPRRFRRELPAIINFVRMRMQSNEETMLEEIKNVKSGQVTYAVRDTKIDDKEIHEGRHHGHRRQRHSGSGQRESRRRRRRCCPRR